MEAQRVEALDVNEVTPVVEGEIASGIADGVEVMILFGDTVLNVEYLSPSHPTLVIGNEGPHTDVVVESSLLGVDTLNVVSLVDSRAVIEFPTLTHAGDATVAAEGDLLEGDVATPIAELVRRGQVKLVNGISSLVLPPSAQARLKLAGLTFLVKPAARPARVQAPRILAGLEWEKERWTVLSVVGHAFFLFLLFSVPAESSSALAADGMSNMRLLPVFTIAPKPEPAPLLPQLASAEGQRAAGTEGKAGTRTDNKDGRAAVRRNNQTETRLPPKTAAQLEKEARSVGILGVLKEKSLGSIFATEAALGIDAATAMGHLEGTKIADADGLGGFGQRGTGPGGGCVGASCGRQTLGMGRLPTIGGFGKGNCPPGEKCDYGKTGGNLDNRHASAPVVSAGPVTVSPEGLDRETVRRVIRQHINEVKYCYEKELTTRPGLYGKVTARMVISPAGLVAEASVTSSTLGSGPAESCIARAAGRWTFPSAPGGRTTIVSYPFVFQSAGR